MCSSRRFAGLIPASVLVGATDLAFAQNDCSGLPSHSALESALQQVVAGGDNAGLGNDMWATIVSRDGVVCRVVFTGAERGDQWPASRIISAQKANTANAFSRPAGGSGDTSCTDHIIAWKVRDALGLDNVPGGVSPTQDDSIIHDVTIDPVTGHTMSERGFGHPECDANGAAREIAEALPETHPVGPDNSQQRRR